MAILIGEYVFPFLYTVFKHLPSILLLVQPVGSLGFWSLEIQDKKKQGITIHKNQ